MITRAQIREKDGGYKYKVLIPVFAGLLDMANTSNITINKEGLLTSAYICSTPFYPSNYELGDIVYVTFEENDLSKPVIIGKLYLADSSKNKFDLQNSLAFLSAYSGIQSNSITNLNDISLQLEAFSSVMFNERYNLLTNWVKTSANFQPTNITHNRDTYKGYCAQLTKNCICATNSPFKGILAQYPGGDGWRTIYKFDPQNPQVTYTSNYNYLNNSYNIFDNSQNFSKETAIALFINALQSAIISNHIISGVLVGFLNSSNPSDYGHIIYIDCIAYNINDLENSRVLWVENCKISGLNYDSITNKNIYIGDDTIKNFIGKRWPKRIFNSIVMFTPNNI